jgi:hypothetical protein
MSIKVRGQRAGASRESLQSSVQVLYLWKGLEGGTGLGRRSLRLRCNSEKIFAKLTGSSNSLPIRVWLGRNGQAILSLLPSMLRNWQGQTQWKPCSRSQKINHTPCGRFLLDFHGYSPEISLTGFPVNLIIIPLSLRICSFLSLMPMHVRLNMRNSSSQSYQDNNPGVLGFLASFKLSCLWKNKTKQETPCHGASHACLLIVNSALSNCIGLLSYWYRLYFHLIHL